MNPGSWDDNCCCVNFAGRLSDYNVLATVLGEHSPATSNENNGLLHREKYQQRLQTLLGSLSPKIGMQSCTGFCTVANPFWGVKSCTVFHTGVNYHANQCENTLKRVCF